MLLGRVGAIAANGFREVIRDRILYFIGFFALLMIIALRLLPQISVGADEKILLDLSLGGIGLLSAVVAIFVGTGLINKEIEKRTVLVLIPKPISRAELMIGKHLGLSAVLLVLVAVMGMIGFGLLSLNGISYPLGAIALSLIYLIIELSLLVAVALLFGVFTSSILATLLSFGVYLVGHFSRDLLELGNLSDNASVKAFTETLYLILPDLSRLNFRNEAVYGLLPNTSELISNALYGVLYTILLLTIASLIFSRRQF
ncbi:type IV pilus biogenesis protein PilI-like protein [Halothece sp. PCC 7418]|uniref:ABC transporter permease n=1 Tax=Halothece sp. (strain PCC 7418) TaxID=65093 RepID=UPI0002A05A7A|nr:ABC transporter permease subunit [Halothece sp. PCC 7418]AFZ43449.1 type IV pilus biogenesis protein PilI-like protein [Halothece sp. PCC 7418]